MSTNPFHEKIQGEKAEFNFLDSAWILKRARSSTPNDIQIALLKLPRLFRSQQIIAIPL
ncbi:hypothetical protein LguiA_007346 [Lonicera macranthoides]